MWDSESGTNHVIKGIETDVEYTLHESKAPEGYEVTADVTFTVAKDGTVTATASVVNGVIIVEDKLETVGEHKHHDREEDNLQRT